MTKKATRPPPIAIPLTFDQAISGLLKVDTKKLPKKTAKTAPKKRAAKKAPKKKRK